MGKLCKLEEPALYQVKTRKHTFRYNLVDFLKIEENMSGSKQEKYSHLQKKKYLQEGGVKMAEK